MMKAYEAWEELWQWAFDHSSGLTRLELVTKMNDLEEKYE